MSSHHVFLPAEQQPDYLPGIHHPVDHRPGGVSPHSERQGCSPLEDPLPMTVLPPSRGRHCFSIETHPTMVAPPIGGGFSHSGTSRPKTSMGSGSGRALIDSGWCPQLEAPPPVVVALEKKSGCGGDEPLLIHADTSIRREVPRRGVHLFPCITVSLLGRRKPLQIDPLPIGDTPHQFRTLSL